MPFPLIAMGVASLLGGILGNRKQQQETTSRQNQYTDMYSEPVYDPKTRALRDRLINEYLTQLEDNGDYFGGYTQQGVNTIAGETEAAQNNISNMLAARGIRGPAAGYASILPQVNAMGQRSSFLNSIPLLADQRRQQILQNTGGFLSSLPLTQRNYGSQTSEGVTRGTIPSNMLGGGFQSLATTLGGYLGSRDNNQNPFGFLQGMGGGAMSYLPSDKSFGLPQQWLNPGYGKK